MMFKLLLSLIFLTALQTLAKAQSIESSSFPLHIKTAQLTGLSGEDVLVIKGKIESATAITLVLRVDDEKSGNYASRANIERRFTAGDFLFEIPLRGLRSVNHRVMNLESLKNLYFFTPDKEATITLTQVAFKKALKLPEGAIGLSFGQPDAPLFQGFERVSSGDVRLSGKTAPVLRIGSDALISSGLVGIEQVKLPFKAGKAVLTLFTEDIGAWETLPAVLHQRIRVNGETVSETKLTPREWVAQRYLKNGSHEATLPLSPWKDYGERRGGRIVIPLTVEQNGVTIEMAGEGAQSTFLSALILEEGDDAKASRFVESERERLFNALWRVRTSDDAFPSLKLSMNTSVQKPIKLTLAKGEATRLELSIVSDEIVKPTLDISGDFAVKAFAGQRRLVRKAANDTLLDYTVGFWRSDISAWELSPTPRPYLFWIEAGEEAKSGSLKITLKAGDKTTIIPVDVSVLPLTLPVNVKPAGFYHDEAPHLLYFRETMNDRTAQLSCDLAFFRTLGINGVAPSLNIRTIESDLDLARNFTAPYLAYTPVKRLIAGYGKEKALKIISETKGDLLWSVADEPGNPDMAAQDIAGLIKALREIAPKAKLAAQLNAPHDMKFVSQIDTALINNGFGVDKATQEAVINQGKKLWFYNLPNTRLASGFFLNASKAESYLQWHSRMPTADPFDPTDGREGDVQVFAPSNNACSSTRDVTSSVFDLAEGLQDQRWMIWLRTQNTAKAKELLKQLDAELAQPWNKLQTYKNSDLNSIRQKIKASTIAIMNP